MTLSSGSMGLAENIDVIDDAISHVTNNVISHVIDDVISHVIDDVISHVIVINHVTIM